MNKRLIDYCKQFENIATDKDIIYYYITSNHLEGEYIKMISDLAFSQQDRLIVRRNNTNFILDSVSMTLNYLLENYPRDIALFLLDLELNYAKTFDFDERLLQKAREIIPTIDCPRWYYNDVTIHLHKKYDIKFKNHDKYPINDYMSRTKELDNEN